MSLESSGRLLMDHGRGFDHHRRSHDSGTDGGGLPFGGGAHRRRAQPTPLRRRVCKEPRHRVLRPPGRWLPKTGAPAFARPHPTTTTRRALFVLTATVAAVYLGPSPTLRLRSWIDPNGDTPARRPQTVGPFQFSVGSMKTWQRCVTGGAFRSAVGQTVAPGSSRESPARSSAACSSRRTSDSTAFPFRACAQSYPLAHHFDCSAR